MLGQDSHAIRKSCSTAGRAVATINATGPCTSLLFRDHLIERDGSEDGASRRHSTVIADEA
jgi:hypothetical protein